MSRSIQKDDWISLIPATYTAEPKLSLCSFYLPKVLKFCFQFSEVSNASSQICLTT